MANGDERDRNRIGGSAVPKFGQPGYTPKYGLAERIEQPPIVKALMRKQGPNPQIPASAPDPRHFGAPGSFMSNLAQRAFGGPEAVAAGTPSPRDFGAPGSMMNTAARRMMQHSPSTFSSVGGFTPHEERMGRGTGPRTPMPAPRDMAAVPGAGAMIPTRSPHGLPMGPEQAKNAYLGISGGGAAGNIADQVAQNIGRYVPMTPEFSQGAQNYAMGEWGRTGNMAATDLLSAMMGGANMQQWMKENPALFTPATITRTASPGALTGRVRQFTTQGPAPIEQMFPWFQQAGTMAGTQDTLRQGLFNQGYVPMAQAEAQYRSARELAPFAVMQAGASAVPKPATGVADIVKSAAEGWGPEELQSFMQNYGQTAPAPEPASGGGGGGMPQISPEFLAKNKDNPQFQAMMREIIDLVGRGE